MHSNLAETIPMRYVGLTSCDTVSTANTLPAGDCEAVRGVHNYRYER